jgi:N-acetyl-beta-hexosaminidase
LAEGTATLLQALSQSNGQVALPKLVIKDWPHADYCAMMIDCGRQEQPIEWLKKMIETCRLYKVRYVHLHLTDDQGWCFPSATYPQLGSKNHGTHGGLAPKVYPLEELKGLVAYADARGIALVPELEVPGHSGAALRSLPLASSSGCPPSPSSPPPLSPRPARATCFSPCSPGTAKTRPSARPPAPAASRSGRVISA